jgi:hypothetical protein
MAKLKYKSECCKECGVIFDGFTQKQADTQLDNHLIKHKNEKREKNGSK